MRTKFKRLAGALALAVGGLATGTASAVSLFDNTGTYDFNLHSSGSVVLAAEDDFGAAQFTIGSQCGAGGCMLDTISLGLSSNQSGPGIQSTPTDFTKFSLSIHDDAGNALGSTVLNGASINNPNATIAFASMGGVTYDFTPAMSVVLNDNTSYWVKLTGNMAAGTAPFLRWDGAAGTGSLRQYEVGGIGPPFGIGGSYLMSIEGTALSAVPIPGAVWLMGSALIGFVGWGRRLKV